MESRVRTLENFRNAVATASPPLGREAIAKMLEASVVEACGEFGLDEADIRCGGPLVMMILTPRHPWEAVVVGPDAYQFYPGFLRDDGETIMWANVWVGENYSLENFVSSLEQELRRAAANEAIP